MAGNERMEAVIEIVHELDALKQRRAQITASIDAQIEEHESRLAELVGAGRPAHVVVRPDTKGGLQSRIRLALRREPGMAYGKLTGLVYGEDSREARGKLRAQVYAMKKKGELEEIQPGRYQLAPEDG